MNLLRNRLAVILLSAAAAVGALSGCSQLDPGLAQSLPTPGPVILEPAPLTAQGWTAPVHSTTLGFAAGGELGEIRVSEGQIVRQGEVMASLGERTLLEAALSQAKLEQLAASQALKSLHERADLMRAQSAQAVPAAQKALLEAAQVLNRLEVNFETRLDELNEAAEDAKDTMDEAQEELDRHQGLDASSKTRKDAQKKYNAARLAYDEALFAIDGWHNQLEQAKAAVVMAQAQLDEAQSVLDAHQEGPDPDDLELAQARLDNANFQAAAAQRALEKAELCAPYEATVVDVNDLEPGEYLAPGTPVVIVADYTRWMVETRDLTELDVVMVEVGDLVRVIPDALPQVELEGVVESIDLAPTQRSGDILYTVHIRLVEVDPRLRWGMTVTITFDKPAKSSGLLEK